MGNHVLIVDDEMGIRELLTEILEDEGYTVSVCANADEARQARLLARPDAVLLDIWMPGCDGVTLLKEWASSGLLTMPVVMMSGHATIDTAVEATRIGAFDFMEKPISLQKLLAMVERAIKTSPAMNPPEIPISGAHSRSPVLASLRERLAQLANLRTPVLLTGDLGVGFEACARYLHPVNTPWVKVESMEQLGQQSLVLLKQASNGTLFVPELSLCHAEAQIGLQYISQRVHEFNVRLICASSAGLGDFCNRFNFEPSLFNLLSRVTIPVPSLAEHREDILDLSKQILQQIVELNKLPARRFNTSALNALKNAEWPGNLDQLYNVIHTAALCAVQGEIDAPFILQVLHQYNQRSQRSLGVTLNFSLDGTLREARDAFERLYFEYHIKQYQGNMSRVAEKAGLERTHLYRKLKVLGMKVHRRGEDE